MKYIKLEIITDEESVEEIKAFPGVQILDEIEFVIEPDEIEDEVLDE